ncbi:MAG: hypothetical protein U5R06_04645 [candidate division KSB1 bacterium]|nr:hypothetical protein [candidate division KSB1 bacterium]
MRWIEETFRTGTDQSRMHSILTDPADKAVAVQFAIWLAVGDFTLDFLTEDRLDPNQSNYNLN